MIAFLVGWLSIVAIVICVCLTVCYAINMYYQNQKAMRLEQMDLSLQNPQLAADTLTVKKITQSYKANGENYSALLARDIKKELLARELIQES